MSVDVAKRYAGALDAEDWDTARELLDADVEIVRPSGRRYHGADRWIELISAPGGFTNIDSAVAARTYEQGNGLVYETTDILHTWRENGERAYTSRERTAITIRNGRIARLESTVEHHAPE